MSFQQLPTYLPYAFSGQQGGLYPQGSNQSFGIPVLPDDVLNFQTWSVAARTLICTVDFVDLAGITSSITLPPNVATNNRLGTATSTKIGGFGRIIAASPTQFVGTAPIGPGETFVALTIKRGAADFVQLFMGYYYPGHVPSFNQTGQTLEHSRAGPGRRYVASGAVPAAGAEIADTVPSNALWRLIGTEVALVTSAAAANRLVNFFVDDAGATKSRNFIATDTTAQTASLTRTHGWYEGVDSPTTASVSIVDGAITLLAKFPTNLPLQYQLTPGSNLRTVTTNIDVGDQYAAARYTVEEWLQTN